MLWAHCLNVETFFAVAFSVSQYYTTLFSSHHSNVFSSNNQEAPQDPPPPPHTHMPRTIHQCIWKKTVATAGTVKLSHSSFCLIVMAQHRGGAHTQVSLSVMLFCAKMEPDLTVCQEDCTYVDCDQGTFGSGTMYITYNAQISMATFWQRVQKQNHNKDTILFIPAPSTQQFGAGQEWQWCFLHQLWIWSQQQSCLKEKQISLDKNCIPDRTGVTHWQSSNKTTIIGSVPEWPALYSLLALFSLTALAIDNNSMLMLLSLTLSVCLSVCLSLRALIPLHEGQWPKWINHPYPNLSLSLSLTHTHTHWYTHTHSLIHTHTYTHMHVPTLAPTP